MLLDAFDSNWIAPLGPHVDAFEEEFASRVGVGHAVALSSGTAALHLALLLLGVGPGDEVLVPSFTFVATANAAVYLGAVPVFVDSSADTWNMDPHLVAAELDRRATAGTLPAAVVTVDLYGQACDYDPLLAACARHAVPRRWARPTGAAAPARSDGWGCSPSTATRSSPPVGAGCW